MHCCPPAAGAESVLVSVAILLKVLEMAES